MNSISRFYNLVLIVVRLFQVTRNPRNTMAGLEVANRMYRIGLMEDNKRMALSRPADAEVIRERKFLSPVDIAKLAQYPAGTLGAEFAKHMISNELELEFYSKLDVVDDETFIIMRLRQTHDIWHVITGFDVTVSGETKLQAFSSAQMHTPLAPLLFGGILIKTGLQSPKRASMVFADISAGWQMGIRAKPVFGIDWDASWGRNLVELRKELQIEAG